MRLRAKDQIHISSVQADSLQPGQEFEVADAAGAELLKRHPATFEEISEAVKAEPAPENKAESAAPANKAKSKAK